MHPITGGRGELGGRMKNGYGACEEKGMGQEGGPPAKHLCEKQHFPLKH